MENPHLYKIVTRSYETFPGLRYRGKNVEDVDNCIPDDKNQVSLEQLDLKSTDKYRKQEDVSYLDYFARSIVSFGKQVADCLNETGQSAYKTVIQQGAEYVDLAKIQFLDDNLPDTVSSPEPLDIGPNATSAPSRPSYEIVVHDTKALSKRDSKLKTGAKLKTKLKTKLVTKIETKLPSPLEKEPEKKQEKEPEQEPEKEMTQGLDSDLSNELDNGWAADVRHEPEDKVDMEKKSVGDLKEELVPQKPQTPPKQVEYEMESEVPPKSIIDINNGSKNDSPENFKAELKVESAMEKRVEHTEHESVVKSLENDMIDKKEDGSSHDGSSHNQSENSALVFSKVAPTIQETPVKSPPTLKSCVATPKPVAKEPVKLSPLTPNAPSVSPKQPVKLSPVTPKAPSVPCELSPAKDDYLKQMEQRIREMFLKKGAKIPQYLMKPPAAVPLTRPLSANDLNCALTCVMNEQLVQVTDLHSYEGKIMMDSSGLRLDSALANIFGHNFLMQRTPACSILPGTLPSSLSAVSIVAPIPGKSCISKPDMFDQVPIFPDHAATPASTPLKPSDFGQRPQPPQLPSGIPRRRRPFINLAIPQKQQKKVTYAPVLVNEKKSFDDVVNSGKSGFRILSKHDKNCGTVEYPAYVAPKD